MNAATEGAFDRLAAAQSAASASRVRCDAANAEHHAAHGEANFVNQELRLATTALAAAVWDERSGAMPSPYDL